MGEITSVANALKEWDKAHEVHCSRLLDSDLLKLIQICQSISELTSMIQDSSTDAELRTLAAEDLTETKETLESLSTTLKHSLIPKHPFAHLPCILEIRPGAGGNEAALFATDLYKMYTQFCSAKGYTMSVVKYDTGDVGTGTEAELLEAVLEIETEGSYDVLRTEAGVHRVQRVPATEKQGRTHTSAASVMVLPSFPKNNESDSAMNFEDPNSDWYVNPADVRSETMRASGAGGQHVNKTDSAIRLTHMPTGTVVAMQESRSQHKNRAAAWSLLRSRLAAQKREAREEELVALRRGALGGVARMGREHKVRTYNWGQGRVTDHRSGMTVYALESVLDGGDGLEKIMESVRGWLAEGELEDLELVEKAEKEKDGKGGGKKGKK